MSRPLRLDQPGALWHVTSRGNERHDVYRDDLDRARWLALLAATASRFGWRLYAYTQMGNHFHVLFESLEATLSSGMRHLNGVYSQGFNRRHGRVGHLFQGRFHAQLVERETHLLEVTRYVVLNPVRGGLVAAAGDWPWSSFRATAGAIEPPSWLDVGWILGHFGGSRERYAEFVAEGLASPFDPARVLGGGIYLGTERFRRDSRRIAAGVERDCEVPRAHRVPLPTPVDDLMPRLLARFDVTREELRQRGATRGRERALVAFALRRFSHAPATSIAGVLGVTSWHAARLARHGEVLWPSTGLAPLDL
jgi:putative transposase